MRLLRLGVVVWIFLCAAASAQTPDAQLMAPIQKFIDSFNKGDAVGAAATHGAGADLTIIDEVSPYLWRGPKAFQAWAADLDSDAKKHGITDQMVTISTATRTEANGDQAYVVVPSVYTFKEGGVAMREVARMTFVLKKDAGGWLIHGWTWTGPKPQRVTARAKP
jgi:ketosteroid isomerase-like protein